MRLNWLSLLPIVLVLAILAMGYIVLTEPADKPRISKAGAMQIAKTVYQDMCTEKSNATLGTYKAGDEVKPVWFIDVKTVPDPDSPNVFIAVVNAGEPAGQPVSWGGMVTIDAITGEVVHVNPVC